MNAAMLKHPLSYGSTRKRASVFISNGSGGRGEIMNLKEEQLELVLLNQINEYVLAKVVVEWIKNNEDLRRAILEVAWKCPNIMTRV